MDRLHLQNMAWIKKEGFNERCKGCLARGPSISAELCNLKNNYPLYY